MGKVTGVRHQLLQNGFLKVSYHWTVGCTYTHNSFKSKSANFLLRKLKFRLGPTLFSLHYKATSETILLCLSAWADNATAYDIKRGIMKARRVCQSQTLRSAEDLLRKLTSRKFNRLKINEFPNHHPLGHKVEFSTRTGRAIFIKSRTERYRKRFYRRPH